VTTHDAGQSRVLGDAHVGGDAADHRGEQLALLLGEADAALLDADVDAGLGDGDEVLALALVELEPDRRLLPDQRAVDAVDGRLE
jgi:hypothetical protein